MASQFFGDSIFWIETDKIRPNPYQPRRDFDEAALRDLAESIRMYGLLQPLVVTRTEIAKEDGGLAVQYELISGERRLRASKLLGLQQVPAIIRADTDDARIKLELAIIENLQREDLNPVERARSFHQLSNEFGLKHVQIAQKIGKSREYVSNTIRLLALPADMLESLSQGKISEGHARPLLMLSERPEEQATLFKEITFKRLTVRETEAYARKIAVERARGKNRFPNVEFAELERKLSETLGTRVSIEQKQKGGKITIDFFSTDDLRAIMDIVEHPTGAKHDPNEMLNKHAAETAAIVADLTAASAPAAAPEAPAAPIDDRSKEEKQEDENSEDLYSIKNFSV
ncbi:MAG: ParB/RepB/Spo0J family partition protein [Patescibacteria group bacterium]|nr:ParB/RepB/Spo0J family partition protein [Patescibacteria group bacterium]